MKSPTKFPLSNQNSCGQGFWENIKNESLYEVLFSFGYEYSHSTNIGQTDGNWKLYHTFKHKNRGTQDHCVGFYMGEETGETCVNISTARKYNFISKQDLIRHLEYKRSQYKLPKLDDKVY